MVRKFNDAYEHITYEYTVESMQEMKQHRITYHVNCTFTHSIKQKHGEPANFAS